MNILEVMQAIEAWPVTRALGWALVHFIWQGFAIAGGLAIALRCLRGASPNTRYLVCCAGLLAMAATPIVTAALAWPGEAPPATEGVLASVLAEPIAASTWERLTPALPAVTVLWLLGVLVLQTRLVFNWSSAQHLRRDGTRPAPTSWQRAVDELCRGMRVRRHVQLLESSLAQVPMVIGWLRPVVLVPTCAFTGLAPEQLRAVIAHELTHVRRHDYLVNLGQAVLETLLFYHPAVWWLSHRLRDEREYCCDDVAVSVCGDTLCYARALSSLDALRDTSRPPVLASTGGSLMNRIRRLAGAGPASARRPGGWLAPTAIMASVTVIASASALHLSAAAAAERVAGHDREIQPIDRVDLAGILRELGHEDADVIGVLRDSGLDNDILMKVIRELGTDDRTIEVIERAAHDAHFIESRMEKVRARIARALTLGRLDIDDAEHALAKHRQDIEHELLDRRHQHAALEADPHLVAIRAEIADRVAAGDLGEAQAKEMLAERVHLVMREREMKQRQIKEERAHAQGELEARWIRLKDEVQIALDEGEITPEEAEVRLARAHEDMAAWHENTVRLEWIPSGAPVDDARIAEVHLAEIRHEVQDMVAAGEITEAEAALKLDIAAEDLHARLRQRPADMEAGVAFEWGERARGADAIKVRVAEAHAHLQEMRDRLDLELDRGSLTEAEAAARLDAAEAEVVKLQTHLNRFEEELHAEQVVVDVEPEQVRGRDGDVRRERVVLELVHQEIADAVAAGRLEKSVAAQQLAETKVQLERVYNQAAMAGELAKKHRVGDDMVRLQKMHDEIAHQVKSGEMTREEAEGRIRQLRAEMDKKRHHRAVLKWRRPAEDRIALLEQLRATRQEIEAAMAAGRLEVPLEVAKQRLNRLSQAESKLAGSKSRQEQEQEQKPEPEPEQVRD